MIDNATIIHLSFVLFFSSHTYDELISFPYEVRPEQAFQDNQTIPKPLPVMELGAYARSSFLYFDSILCKSLDYWK